VLQSRVLSSAGAALAAIFTVAGSILLQAQAPPALDKLLYNAADAIGMLRDVDEEDGIARVELWATGTMNVDGQTFKLAKFRASINYDEPGIRIDLTRAGADGRELPREIHVAARTFAWTEKTPGTGATPANEMAEECILQIWSTPFGVIKAARTAGAKATVAAEGGATVLTVPVGRATLKATLNARNLIERVETRLGTVVTETTYADYRDLNDADYKADVFWPRRITQKRDGVTVLDLTLTRTNTYNPYVVMPVPDSVRKAAPAAPAS
jgi:hypothetical protein